MSTGMYVTAFAACRAFSCYRPGVCICHIGESRSRQKSRDCASCTCASFSVCRGSAWVSNSIWYMCVPSTQNGLASITRIAVFGGQCRQANSATDTGLSDERTPCVGGLPRYVAGEDHPNLMDDPLWLAARKVILELLLLRLCLS